MVFKKKLWIVGVAVVGLLAANPAQAVEEKATIVNSCTGDLNKLHLYPAILGRKPDVGGANSWLMSKSSLYDTAKAFLQSSEFKLERNNLTDAQFVERLFVQGLGRASVDDASIVEWTNIIEEEGRAGAAVRIAQSKEAANEHRYVRSDFCSFANTFSGEDLAAGVTYSKKGSTVVVLVDPKAAMVDTLATPNRATSSAVIQSEEVDVAMNANWFDSRNKTIAPLVSDTKSVGGKDDATKGFLGERIDGRKTSIWHGFVLEPPADTRMGASGIHIVHQGKSAEVFAPEMFDDGYTFTTKKHSALGYTEQGYWILISSYTNNARSLSKRMLDYGAVEAVMLDGGGSTQIAIDGRSGIRQILQRPVTSHITVRSNDKVFN